MNFIKENSEYDIVWNSLQMRINFYETGNCATSADYLRSKLRPTLIISRETNEKITKLRLLQKKCKYKRIFK